MIEYKIINRNTHWLVTKDSLQLSNDTFSFHVEGTQFLTRQHAIDVLRHHINLSGVVNYRISEII